MPPAKKRLDLRVVELGVAESRQRAQALIMAGKILVNGEPVDKPGVAVSEADKIVMKGEGIPYVSRGGLKLAAALEACDVPVDGAICMDVGASTGGFTDCLLQHGAAHVYAVDVGYGQLAWKLREDPRVTVIERTNIRHMDRSALPGPVDLVTIDTSFISLKIVVPSVLKFMKDGSVILALIKPQFEVGKGKVGKGGVVRDSRRRAEVIETLSTFFEDMGLVPKMVVPSPVLGPKGNQEFVILLEYPASRSNSS
jgi:23S rRNA (cytidine1920-2'-O)/16S rRNA (cytidine1409-2'-O)-methyltransferase